LVLRVAGVFPIEAPKRHIFDAGKAFLVWRGISSASEKSTADDGYASYSVFGDFSFLILYLEKLMPNCLESVARTFE
jgi:hypothetical protein